MIIANMHGSQVSFRVFSKTISELTGYNLRWLLISLLVAMGQCSIKYSLATSISGSTGKYIYFGFGVDRSISASKQCWFISCLAGMVEA